MLDIMICSTVRFSEYQRLHGCVCMANCNPQSSAELGLCAVQKVALLPDSPGFCVLAGGGSAPAFAAPFTPSWGGQYPGGPCVYCSHEPQFSEALLTCPKHHSCCGIDRTVHPAPEVHTDF